MDSQHRHELQENELAHWLERQIENVKPHLPLIILGAVAVGIGVGALNWMRSSTQSANVASWDGYARAVEGPQPNLALLQRVTEDLDGSDAADWAGITLADGKLFAAAQSYLFNRESSTSTLEEAQELYEQLRGARNASVRSRAAFGLARVAEVSGNLDEAKTLYYQVSGAFQSVAEQRAEELDSETVAGDFAWLATAQASAVTPPSGPGVPGLTPDFDVDLIDTPLEEAEKPSGASVLDDILESAEAEEAAAEEAAIEAADLQLAAPETSAADEDSDASDSDTDESKDEPAAEEDTAEEDAKEESDDEESDDEEAEE